MDAGKTWAALSIDATKNLSFIYFTDANTGYVISEDEGIFKTTNAGTTWTKFKLNKKKLYSGYFTDANTGYIVGSDGLIIKISNDGINWNNYHQDYLNLKKKSNMDELLATLLIGLICATIVGTAYFLGLRL